MDSKFWKLGIIGWPLGYSLSPLMHRAALKAAGLQGEYKEYPVKPEQLESWLETEAPKLDGFNVTMPHKVKAWEQISQHGEFGKPFPELVRAIGAVNTVSVQNKRLVGYDTDGIGFLEPFEHSGTFQGKNVLLLGAGGAAQAIAAYLVHSEQIGSLRIWNRHLDRAEKLVERVKELDGPCQAMVVSNLEDLSVDQMALIVNATPMGMAGNGEVLREVLEPLHPSQVVYDIVYEPKETGLILAARKAGCKVITGDEMLAAQGAAAFEIWTAVPAAKVLPAMHKAPEEYFGDRP